MIWVLLTNKKINGIGRIRLRQIPAVPEPLGVLFLNQHVDIGLHGVLCGASVLVEKLNIEIDITANPGEVVVVDLEGLLAEGLADHLRLEVVGVDGAIVLDSWAVLKSDGFQAV